MTTRWRFGGAAPAAQVLGPLGKARNAVAGLPTLFSVSPLKQKNGEWSFFPKLEGRNVNRPSNVIFLLFKCPVLVLMEWTTVHSLPPQVLRVRPLVTLPLILLSNVPQSLPKILWSSDTTLPCKS